MALNASGSWFAMALIQAAVVALAFKHGPQCIRTVQLEISEANKNRDGSWCTVAPAALNGSGSWLATASIQAVCLN